MLLNELRELNKDHHIESCLNEGDVIKAMEYIALIESSRSNKEPKPGDIIVCVSPKKGIVANRGHIEKAWFNEKYPLTICTEPYIPFISHSKRNQEGYYLNTSGGYWTGVQKSDLFLFKKLGEGDKLFQDWGHCGAGAAQSMKFKAIVNIWEYTSESFY